LCCTTCGGTLDFASRLHVVAPSNSTLVQFLTNISTAEALLLSTDRYVGRSAVAAATAILEPHERSQLHAGWTERARDDPELALAILVWTQAGRDVSAQQLAFVLASADVALARRARVREWILEHLPAGAEVPPRTRQAAAKVAAATESRTRLIREAADARRREREVRFAEIERLPFPERIRLLATRPRLNFESGTEERKWRARWSTLHPADVRSIPLHELQDLIDQCAQLGIDTASASTFRALLDLRHELRMQAMNELRAELASMPPLDRFIELARRMTPIASFPVELAYQLAHDWIHRLDSAARTHFLSELSRTRLRRWRAASKRLGFVSGI
jgi:hypothetical protein